MYLPFILATLPVGLFAASVAWYYDRQFQNVRYEYLGSTRAGLSGQADDVYHALIRPLRARRLIALCIATIATCIAIILVGLQNI